MKRFYLFIIIFNFVILGASYEATCSNYIRRNNSSPQKLCMVGSDWVVSDINEEKDAKVDDKKPFSAYVSMLVKDAPLETQDMQKVKGCFGSYSKLCEKGRIFNRLNRAGVPIERVVETLDKDGRLIEKIVEKLDKNRIPSVITVETLDKDGKLIERNIKSLDEYGEITQTTVEKLDEDSRYIKRTIEKLSGYGAPIERIVEKLNSYGIPIERVTEVLNKNGEYKRTVEKLNKCKSTIEVLGEGRRQVEVIGKEKTTLDEKYTTRSPIYENNNDLAQRMLLGDKQAAEESNKRLSKLIKECNEELCLPSSYNKEIRTLATKFCNDDNNDKTKDSIKNQDQLVEKEVSSDENQKEYFKGFWLPSGFKSDYIEAEKECKISNNTSCRDQNVVTELFVKPNNANAKNNELLLNKPVVRELFVKSNSANATNDGKRKKDINGNVNGGSLRTSKYRTKVDDQKQDKKGQGASRYQVSNTTAKTVNASTKCSQNINPLFNYNDPSPLGEYIDDYKTNTKEKVSDLNNLKQPKANRFENFCNNSFIPLDEYKLNEEESNELTAIWNHLVYGAYSTDSSIMSSSVGINDPQHCE